MPSHASDPKREASQRNYRLTTNVVAPESTTSTTATTAADAEIDLYADSWKLPYSIDDLDLTFDGKPLNMLYEENRWMAEHHYNHQQQQEMDGSRDYSSYSHASSSSSSSATSSSSGSSSKKEKSHQQQKKSRGRSRQSKK